MKILITGGAGYIGSHTAVSLIDAGHQIYIYDNFSSGTLEVANHLVKTFSNIILIEGDVRNFLLLEDSIKKYKIEVVFHFAGLKSVSESLAHPIEYYSNNVQGSISLISAMIKTNVKTLIFSSSATVYGNPEYLPLDEEHSKHPINPYGKSKLQVEEILADISKAYPDFRIACLRYFNPVGAHDFGLIGEVTNTQPNNLMPFIVKVASGIAPKLNIFGNDYNSIDGTALRDYVHVMDVAEGHLAALDYLNQRTGINFFNLGTGKGLTVLQMVKAFELYTGKDIKFEFMPRRNGDVSNIYASVDKALLLLKWKAKRGIKEICQTSWNWESKK